MAVVVALGAQLASPCRWAALSRSRGAGGALDGRIEIGGKTHSFGVLPVASLKEKRSKTKGVVKGESFAAETQGELGCGERRIVDSGCEKWMLPLTVCRLLRRSPGKTMTVHNSGTASVLRPVPGLTGRAAGVPPLTDAPTNHSRCKGYGPREPYSANDRHYCFEWCPASPCGQYASTRKYTDKPYSIAGATESSPPQRF